MKKIFLYKGRGKNRKLTETFVKVDDEDYEELSKHEWGYMSLYHCESDKLYARRYVYDPTLKLTTAILMHRVILNLSDRKTKCDHIDDDTLNNQKANLRPCSHSQNMSNRVKKNNSSSKFLGVFLSSKKRWAVSIKHEGNSIRKTFKTEIEAALFYNEKAKMLKGKFAKLNILNNA